MPTIDSQPRLKSLTSQGKLSVSEALSGLDQFASPKELATAVNAYLREDPIVRALTEKARESGIFTVAEMPSHCEWGSAALRATSYGLRLSIPHLEGENGLYKLTEEYLSLYDRKFDFRKLPEVVSRVYQGMTRDANPTTVEKAVEAPGLSGPTLVPIEGMRQDNLKMRFDDTRFLIAEKFLGFGRGVTIACAAAGFLATAGVVGYGTWNVMMEATGSQIVKVISAAVLAPALGVTVGIPGAMACGLLVRVGLSLVLYPIESLLTLKFNPRTQTAR